MHGWRYKCIDKRWIRLQCQCKKAARWNKNLNTIRSTHTQAHANHAKYLCSPQLWNPFQFLVEYMSVDLCLHQASENCLRLAPKLPKCLAVVRMWTAEFTVIVFGMYGDDCTAAATASLTTPPQPRMDKNHKYHHERQWVWICKSDDKLPWVFGSIETPSCEHEKREQT